MAGRNKVGADMAPLEAMWISFLIVLGMLAIPFTIGACLNLSGRRYCKTYHSGITHEKWEETIHGS